MPHLIDSCPLPTHNGNLNQLAYSLFLFIRDIANGDLVGWIDARLARPSLGLRRVELGEGKLQLWARSPACMGHPTRS